ncbi:MAG: GHKL domain-containing protein [bacterium]
MYVAIALIISLIIIIIFLSINLHFTRKILFNLADEHRKILEKIKIHDHNMKNKMLAFETIKNEEENEMINDLFLTNIINKKNFIFPDVPKSLCPLIYEKLKDVDVVFQFHANIKDKKIEQQMRKVKFYELLKTMGIALDNAIDAIENVENSYINIDIFENEEEFIIEMSNNFADIIDIDSLGEKNKSSKSRKRGLGLYSILTHDVIKSEIEIRNKNFKLILKVEKKEKVKNDGK